MSLGKWISFLALAIAVYIMWQIRQLLLLLFTAVVLANALNILVKKFQKWGIKRGYAVLLAVLLFLTSLISFFWLIVPSFVEQFQELIVRVPEGIQQLNLWIYDLAYRLNLREYLPNLGDLVNQLIQQLQPILAGGWAFLGGGLTFLNTFSGILLNLLLVFILTLMLLANPRPYRQGFIRLFPSFYRRRVDEILVLCDLALQGWLTGILFNMLVITILSFIGLLILRIPLAFAQAMLTGILTFIPNVGPTLSVLSPMTIALLDGPWKSLAVLIVYVIIQQVESNLLTPLVMAQQVSLLPAVTLLAQVFFATFFGFLGLLIALPLTVIGQVWIKEVLIKDILDCWEPKPKQQASLATASAHPTNPTNMLPSTTTENPQPIPEDLPPSENEE